jgi:hypothetical protein
LTPQIVDSVSFLDDFRLRGGDAIVDLPNERREETLHLEFKTLSDQSSGLLSKDDRRMLAKAICGFSNSDGGILLIGIKTARVDGLDAAVELKPVHQLGTIRNRIASALPEMLSPQHTGIVIYSIPQTDDPSSGFIAIHIPRSDLRPHMSIVHHQYFRRGSDGTRVLDHLEVRDLMMAQQQGAVGLKHFFRSNMSSGDLKFDVDLVLLLENKGRVPVRAPFLRSSSREVIAEEPNMLGRPVLFSARFNSSGGVGLYSSADTILHVGDEIPIGKIRTGIDFRVLKETDITRAIERIRSTKDQDLFYIRQWQASLGSTNFDHLIDVAVSLGAENVPMTEERIAYDKWQMFEKLSEAILK